jgi:hypothetical protein
VLGRFKKINRIGNTFNGRVARPDFSPGCVFIKITPFWVDRFIAIYPFFVLDKGLRKMYDKYIGIKNVIRTKNVCITQQFVVSFSFIFGLRARKSADDDKYN